MNNPFFNFVNKLTESQQTKNNEIKQQSMEEEKK